jgi:hypothetical protein
LSGREGAYRRRPKRAVCNRRHHLGEDRRGGLPVAQHDLGEIERAIRHMRVTFATGSAVSG